MTRTAYDRFAADYALAFPDLSAETPGDRMLIEHFAGTVNQPGPVLDVGCGTGRVAAHLVTLGLAPIGVDISSGMLAKARQLQPRLPLVVGSVTQLPFSSASAAAVLAWYSLIHTAPGELPSAIAELARVLKVGASYLLAFQCGTGERIEQTSTFGHDVPQVNYRHEVALVAKALAHHGMAVAETVVRDPVGGYETTQQAFLRGVREPRQ